MKLKAFYETAVKVGMEHDPRKKSEIKAFLKERKKEFDGLKTGEKKYFDKERLKNPYSDTRIFRGDGDLDVQSVMVGIDIGGEELLLADRLRERGRKIDLVLTHHPWGHTPNFGDVMWLQTDMMQDLGIPINIAEALFHERIDQLDRRFLPANHHRTTDIATHLDIPFMSIHTPADNCVSDHLTKKIKRNKPHTIEALLKLLEEDEEYKRAKGESTGLKLFAGRKSNRTGEILVKMTGGTEGPKEIIEKLATNTKVGTIVGMHMSEDMLKEAKKHHVNVVIAGHMASDTLGINLLLDEVLGREKMEIIECSSFRRITRWKA